MTRTRGILLTMMVWLTVASTLLAAMPHFTCRCADGSLKVLGFGTLAETTATCCAGSCCDSSNESAVGPACCKEKHSAGHAATNGCCSQKDIVANSDRQPAPSNQPARQAKNERPETAAISSVCCLVTMDQNADQGLLGHESQSAKDLQSHLGIASLCVSETFSSSITTENVSLQSNSSPPPPDLIVALQRLVI